MSIIKDFKNFAMRGNVLDMAVGVIIGAAFGKIISSLVSDILMPILSLAMGKADLSNHFIVLSSQHVKTLAEAKQAGIPVIAYGTFIDTVTYFIIQTFAIFLIVRFAMKLKKTEPEAEPKRLCPYCKTEIADDATRCPHCTSQL